MKANVKQWVSLLSSRLALNLYFWLFLFLIKQSDADDQFVYSKPFYYAVILFYMSIFAGLGYLNNLVLIPKFLLRKKHFLYFVWIIIAVLLSSFSYTFLLKLLPILYPGLNSLEMSLIMDPTNNDISFWGIVNDMQTYFSWMVVWVIIFSLLAIYHHSVKKMNQMQEAINKHREVELAFLKNQLNPHFLFNTLNNIYALALKKSDYTPEAVLKLSTLMRYILYESNQEFVSFKKEKEMVQAYIDIELLRLPDSPQLQFTLAAEEEEAHIPPLLWLPILENAFKHGRSTEDLQIDFTFAIQQQTLLIKCKNNIPAKPLVTKEGGIGLKNLHKRLELLFASRYELHQFSDENFFNIELKINY